MGPHEGRSVPTRPPATGPRGHPRTWARTWARAAAPGNAGRAGPCASPAGQPRRPTRLLPCQEAAGLGCPVRGFLPWLASATHFRRFSGLICSPSFCGNTDSPLRSTVGVPRKFFSSKA